MLQLTLDGSPPGKLGENTWNARLAEALRKRGFPSADFELHFPILRGRPRKPDVAFSNGGTNLVSGKLGEDKEFDAFSSAQEYQQLIGATTNLGEVFAVVYPSSKRETFILHLLANPEHERQSWRPGSLPDLVETIHEIVQKRIDYLKRPVEPPDAAVVRLLRQGVEVLHLSARLANEDKLKEVFGGADFFDSVLSASIPKEDRKVVLSRAASFLFVNQVLFYSILRREVGTYPLIDVEDMPSAEKIRKTYFARVLEKNYRPIFEINVASLFDPSTSRDGCLRVVRLIQDLSRSVSTHDLIGKVFHEIIPLEFRKLVAAFYTNSAAGDLLAKLSVTDSETRILDPACGSGTLLVSAYRRKVELANNTNQRPVELHRKFVEQQLTGLDVMAFSAHLAAVQLLLQEPLQYTEHLRIATKDSTRIAIGMRIDPLAETIREAFRQRKMDDFDTGTHRMMEYERAKAGAVIVGSPNRESFTLTDVDLVIMNPPFTSSRRMSSDYKRDLKQRFRKETRYEKLVKGNVGYHLYFICIADKLLAPKGRMAVVMPFTTLIGGDFSELTRFLVGNYSIEYIVCGQGRSAFSENTMFSEILFVAQKVRPSPSHRSVLLLTKTSPVSWSTNQVTQIYEVAQSAKTDKRFADTSLVKATNFDQRELLPEGKTLTRLVADLDESYELAGKELKRFLERNSLVTTFHNLRKAQVLQLKVAEVVHGKSDTGEGHSLTRFGGDALVACRTEERALMKHDRLVFSEAKRRFTRIRDKATGDVFEVPNDVITPALRRFAYIDQFELSGNEDLVINKAYDGIEHLFKTILKKNRVAKALKSLCDEWEDVVRSGSASVCLPGRIDLAAPGSMLLAVRSDRPMFMCSFMWGIYGLDEEEEKIITLWLNSALFFYAALSRQTVTRGSWVKLHGKQLDKMPVIDVRKLTKSMKRNLVSLYDELSEFTWPSILDQYKDPPAERRRLDSGLLKELGATNDEIKTSLDSAYDGIANSLKTMQSTMEAD